MMLDLPPKFVQTIQQTYQKEGRGWLESLPGLLDEASRRWGLTDIQPVPQLSYNFVAFARDVSGSINRLKDPDEVVLKAGVPNRELTSEIAALRHYNGRGAVRLLDADAKKGLLLLERLQPGRMLSTLADDDRATGIAADVIGQLWECSTPFSISAAKVASTGFIQLKDWFAGFMRLRRQFDGKTGSLPERLVAKAESLSGDLLSENRDEALLHGDFHHFNVLESARGWLAIDPKGVIGPRGYEVGPLLINPLPGFLSRSDPKGQTERRIAILAEKLGMEPERIRAWGFCHAVMSAWWSIEGNNPDQAAYSIQCAGLLGEKHA